MTARETITRRTTPLLPGAHRVVRRLGDGEGPFPGVLVTDGESMAVLRDAEGLAGWGGWSCAGARHVAAPLDVVRRADGHDVLLPWCTERVGVFLGRRARQGRALSGGEVSTLAVSVLRGIGALDAAPVEARDGAWWLSDDGCPMFVMGEGGEARVAGAEVLDAVAAESADRVQRRVLGAIAEGLRGAADRPGTPRRQLEAWETELLAVASPRPLALGAGADEAPENAGRVIGVSTDALAARGEGGGLARAERRGAARAEARGERRGVVRAGGRGKRRAGTGASALSGAAAALSAVATRGFAAIGVWSSPLWGARRPATGDARRAGRDAASTRPGRRVPRLAVGLAAAGAVLAAGLLWPAEPSDGESSEAAVERRSPAGDESHGGGAGPSARADPRAEEREDAEVDVADGVDMTDSGAAPDAVIERAAAELASAIRECAASGDRLCASAVVSGAAHVVALFEGAAEGVDDVQLVDEYGGAAVVRLSDSGASEGAEVGAGEYDRMLVLVRVDEKWLVRDAYDVADQPG